MIIHEYLIDDVASGDKYIVADINPFEAKEKLGNKLCEIEVQYWNNDETASMSNQLNADIQYGHFHSLSLAEINKQLYDLEITYFEVEIAEEISQNND